MMKNNLDKGRKIFEIKNRGSPIPLFKTNLINEYEILYT